MTTCSACATELHEHNTLVSSQTCMSRGCKTADVCDDCCSDLRLDPGESIQYTARMLASGKVIIERLMADQQTMQTDINHGLAVGDKVHIEFSEGTATGFQTTAVLSVSAVPSPNQFILMDSTSTVVTVATEYVEDPDPATVGVPLTGWIAKAADLTNYRGRLRIVLADYRKDQLLGISSLKSGKNVVQVKGDWAVEPGDLITVAGFTSTVITASPYRYRNECYTFIKVEGSPSISLAYSEQELAHIQPQNTVIDASVPALDGGWIGVSIPGVRTQELEKYVESFDCNGKIVGRWEFRMELGNESIPEHMITSDDMYWSNVFEKGLVIV